MCQSIKYLRGALALLILVSMAQFGYAQTARVQVIHNSPYVEADTVDVYINDALTLDDFAFRDATPFVDLPAGVPVKIDVTANDAADNTSPVFTTTIDAGLPDAGTLVIIAAGDPLGRTDNPPFDLFIAEAREAAATAGNTEFQAFHGSPDAPSVDVVARGVGTLLDDFSFGDFGDDYLSVAPASYDLDIQTADNSATAASFNADLSAAANAALIVLASGFLAPATSDNPGFGLLAAFADGTTALLPAIDPPPVEEQMARVQVVHNSPYAEAAVVDVYLNDALTLDDFAFRDATPFLDLPADVPVKIDVTGNDAADNSSPVFTASLDDGLPADATMLVIAAGDPLNRAGNPEFNVFIAEAREVAATSGNAEFLVFHGSPDAPTVDVAVRGVGVVVDDISFGEYADDYLSVPPADYEVDVETADNSATAASFGANLSGAADAAIAVLASGFLAPAAGSDPGFGLLAVFPDGTTALLPALEESVTFTLIDADSDSPIAEFDPIPQGATLDLASLPAVNIRANIGEAGSVRFDLNDTEGVRIENIAPYALCGDLDGDYLPCHLPQGDHVLTATAFSEGGGFGEAGESGSVSFSVINGGNALSSFYLVDAETDEDIMALEDGMALDLDTLPVSLNVRAEAGDKVKSVRFELSPTDYSRVENVPPFALYGDLSSDYLGGSFEEGDITITATPYTMTRTEGDAGEPLSITVQVSGSSSGKAGVLRGHSEEPVEYIALNGEGENNVPQEFKLDGNYPNPFNPTTTIAFSLPENAQVRIAVYDMLGRQVRVLVDGPMVAGRNEVVFDAAGLPTGTYLYRVSTPTQSLTRKMLLVK